MVRVVLGAFLVLAGVAHLTFARQDFRAQVPSWLPVDADFTIVVSGVVEVLLGAAFVLLPRHRRLLGLVLALFFVAVFPGNVAQYAEHRDAFGLDDDGKRLARLFFQPVLVAWALWAGETWRSRRSSTRAGPRASRTPPPSR